MNEYLKLTRNGPILEIVLDLLMAAPLSLAAIKEAVNLTEQMSFEECFESLHTRSWPAFVEKREPVWKGE